MYSFVRFCGLLKEEASTDISKAEINALEKLIDSIYKHVGIDVVFTKHFFDRVNDERNGKAITLKEIYQLFVKEFNTHGKKIEKFPPDFEAVLNDLQTKINIPFVMSWDTKNNEMDLVAKTVMRNRDFKTMSDKLTVK